MSFCRGRLQFKKGGDDEDIATAIGPVTRARARQLNYQVFSFLAGSSNINEHMILPKWDIFILFQNEGLSMDGRDAAWSKRKHEEEGMCARRSRSYDQGPDIRPGPDIRRTGHPVRTGHPAKDAIFCCLASGNPDSTGHPMVTGHPAKNSFFCYLASRNPDSTGHPVDRTSRGYRTSVAFPSPGVNSVLLEF